MNTSQPTPQPDSEKMVADRPMIDNVGKAIVNDLLVRYLIKQMNNDGNLSVVTFKMEELKKAKKSSIEKTLTSYGARALQMYGGLAEVENGFDKQLIHLREWIGSDDNTLQK